LLRPTGFERALLLAIIVGVIVTILLVFLALDALHGTFPMPNIDG